MSDLIGLLAFIGIVIALALGISAVIIAAYRDGTLGEDYRWVRAYIRTELAHRKYSSQN
jgi:hypothetical protein